MAACVTIKSEVSSPHLMKRALRHLSLGLLASAIYIASLPVMAKEYGSADDLGVMSISLKDVVKPQVGF